MSHYEASPRPGARLSRPARAHAAAPAELRLAALARCIPVAILVLAAVAGLAWRDHGSPNAKDWLKYALLAGITVVGVLISNRATRPRPPALLALAALGGMAILATISITYAPIPNLARDEALLTVLYAAVFAVPALMLRTREDRTYATGLIVAGTSGLAVCAALALVMRSHPELYFYGGRLNFPITYPNGQAAAMLIGYWPALALASRRSGALWLRALALGGATASISGWLLTQSKGGAIGLLVSTVVVFAVSQRRLRLFLPWTITMVFAAIGAVPLTAPIRTNTTAGLRSAVHHGGAVLLWLTLAGTIAGLLYALADRKLDLTAPTRILLGRIALVGVILAVIAGPGYFFATVEGPGAFVSNQWHAFQKQPTVESSGTHLLTLGSNRYDFWRVALSEFGGHPLAGIGSRGFGAAYLQHGRSQETPARAHSLPLDTLAELGLLGFLALLLVFSPPVAAVVRRARTELTSAGVLAGCVYFMAHACVDWIWTIPAVGVLAMLLLSVAAATAPGDGGTIPRRTSLLTAGAVLMVSLIAFVPSWLAANYAQRAAKGGVGLDGDISWSKRLDPLAIEPYVAQARWAGSLENALVPLSQAVKLQPDSYATHYLYGIDLLKVGRLQEAHQELFRAWQLAPRDPFVNAALRLSPFSRPPR